MTGTRARWSAALMVCMIIAACTPRDVTTWIDLHGADSSELPPEVVDVLADFATRITPADWIDLGHGIWGPPILSPIRSCESGARSSANRPYVPSGNYGRSEPRQFGVGWLPVHLLDMAFRGPRGAVRRIKRG